MTGFVGDRRTLLAALPADGLGQDYEILDRLYRDPASLMARKATLIDSWLPGGQCLVDIGCGTGEIVSRVTGRYTNVIGLDADPAAIDWCRTRFDAQTNVQLIVQDIRADLSTNLRDLEPTTIVLTDVIEHVDEETSLTVLRAAASALPIGGELIVTAPNWYDAIWRRLRPSHHLQCHSSLGWAKHLRRAGFDVTKIETVAFPVWDLPLARRRLHLFGMCVAIHARAGSQST